MTKEYKSCPTDESSMKNGTESKKSKSRTLKQHLTALVPILDWLPKYKWKEWLHGDIIAGLTVGIMHVPQGMAYASLAGVPPVYGMFSSFFASTIYMFFGTARHISIGVFAVASLMVGAARMRLVPDLEPGQDPNTLPLGPDVTVMQMCSALTCLVGFIQILMGICRLGFLTTYLSDPLVSGFTTGSAAHVLVSQLNKVLNVKLPRHEGVGMLLLMVRDLVLSIPQSNLIAVGISVFGILFLDLGRTYLNPFTKRFFPIPLPLELILVIIGVAVSMFFDLHGTYGLKIVNTIQRGLPMPEVPKFSLFPYLLSDAVAIAVICYMFVMSMGKLFAKKHKYKTDPTQELYAIGIMSTLSSFFPVYPVGASLSRSSVCEMSGANTQLYTLYSSTLLLTVILLLGPFLEPLPMCILACIVMVSLKGLFLQSKDLPRLWRLCRYDFVTWLVACLSTICLDVTMGLVISLAFAIFTVVLREQWPEFNEMEVRDVPPQHVSNGVKVLKFDSNLHFANVNHFVDKVTDLIVNSVQTEPCCKGAVIIDCSAISFIDTMGLESVRDLEKEAKKNDVVLLFAGFSEKIESLLREDESLKVSASSMPKSVNCALLQVSAIV